MKNERLDQQSSSKSGTTISTVGRGPEPGSGFRRCKEDLPTWREEDKKRVDDGSRVDVVSRHKEFPSSMVAAAIRPTDMKVGGENGTNFWLSIVLSP